MSATRPLQNRVEPGGALVANRARGMLLGNRGGKFHRDDRSLGRRRWASRQWIACECAFKGRRRDVWGAGYTQVFFLDEVTALAAGHRPCFECRRADAKSFARAMAADGAPPSAPAMDARLHSERLAPLKPKLNARQIAALPDGAVIALDGVYFALRGKGCLRWSFEGYGPITARREFARAELTTPPAIIHALLAGYSPRWAPAS